jgi:hypothetical protein
MRGQGGDAGGIKGQLKYQARVKVIATGGQVAAEGGGISVTHANEVTLLIAAATSYKRVRRRERRSRGDRHDRLAAPPRSPSTNCARPTWRITRRCSAA